MNQLNCYIVSCPLENVPSWFGTLFCPAPMLLVCCGISAPCFTLHSVLAGLLGNCEDTKMRNHRYSIRMCAK